MNPFDEQRLRDEVIYLHSLWHQGPPRRQPPPPPPPPPPPQYPIHLPFSQPYFSQSTLHLPHHRQFVPTHTRSLPPIASTSFKKKKNHKRTHNVAQPDPGPEWPFPVQFEPAQTTVSGWAVFKPGSAPPPSVTVPSEQKERLAALQAQHKACQAFKEFLLNDDDDGDDSEDDGEGSGEIEEFILGVFEKDHGLRGYYQRCFESGEFCCLVCDAIGKKNSGKRFKDCVSLVQHATSILRTLKKRAHRAFGFAVCKVLGWDVDRLPTIVMKGNPLGVEVKPAETQYPSKEGNVSNNVENLDEKVLGMGSKNGGGGTTDEK